MGRPAPSFDDLVALGKAQAQALRPDLAFLDGDVTEAQIYAAAAMADAVLGYSAVRERNLFFGGASGSDLDTVILDKLGLAREPSSRSYGEVTIARATSGGTAGTISSGTQIATAIGTDGTRVVVSLDADVIVPTGVFSTVASATAVYYGKAGNAAAGTLVKWVTSILSGDTTVTVTNAEAFAGGNDSQSDEDYVAAARLLWQTQRRGVLDAIEAGALTVTGVDVAVATEDIDSGICTLYVSDSDGASNGKMIRDVDAALEAWRAAGSLVTVVGGVRGELSLTISIDEYERGFDVAAAAQTIIDSVTTRINRLRVDQNLSLDSLTAAVIAPFATSISKVSFPSIILTVGGTSTVIYEADSDEIEAGGCLIRVGATPVVVDGA